MKLHRLLKRQLKKLNLSDEQLKLIEPMLPDVNKAYQDFDIDIAHLENIVEKSSQELYDANTKLRQNVASISSQLDRVVNNIHEIIFETDLEGNWTYLNPAWEKMTGRTIEESLGKPYSDFFKDENNETIFGDIAFKDIGNKAFKRVFKYINHKEEITWAEVSLKIVVNDQGRYEGSIGSIVDITKLKEIEEALIASRDQEAYANQAKNEFLSTMSHEIRTPLNAVIGVSHLLLMEDPKEEQLENLNALKYSSEHLLGLVNDILDFNKIESGQLELENADFSFTHILNGLQSTFQQKAEEKRIRFRIKKDDGLPEVMKGDSMRLSQVLTNLVNNAIKFTEEGKVTLDIEVIKKVDDKIYLQFEVIDTGIGIPEDKLETIFESFTQANSNTTRKYGGTGLGLAICKKLLGLMDTDLKVESTVDRGTTFSFELCLETSNQFSQTRPQYSNTIPSFSGLNGLKVLVAEDHKMNIMVIKRFFKKWEIDFDIAENGAIAVQMAEAKNYNIILMDLQMPVMNGYDASATIRKSINPHNQSIPIYALSASAAMDVKNNVKQYGMNGHISKPFNPSDLYQILKSYME